MAVPQTDYRLSHAGVGYGARYKDNYERGYYAGLWRSVEGPMLRSLLEKYCDSSVPCLDFACGTGRITRLAATYFDKVSGVDVSESMLAQAEVPANVILKRVDLTREQLPEMFGTALAFRFFLKAEPSLRSDALIAIRRHLQAGAPFIMNIHMTPSSPIGALYDLIKWLRGRVVHPTASPSEMVALLSAHNFKVDEVLYYGYLPRLGHYLPSMSERFVAPFERVALALHLPQSLCQSFIVVAHAV